MNSTDKLDSHTPMMQQYHFSVIKLLKLRNKVFT
ncbi:Uncharacterised protein [Serratia entomophila]|nr:Uncharacterised protein [Serratia entomophila]CAI1812354.1 Uncharacterised protein [Serratia entomophila]CAI2063572.1 Uncharacterised protein [Serratia entomophila]